MHLVIYGSEESGLVTINVDGTRVRLKRAAEGNGWVPSDPRQLRELRSRCVHELPSVLALLLAEPESTVRPVTS